MVSCTIEILMTKNGIINLVQLEQLHWVREFCTWGHISNLHLNSTTIIVSWVPSLWRVSVVLPSPRRHFDCQVWWFVRPLLPWVHRCRSCPHSSSRRRRAACSGWCAVCSQLSPVPLQSTASAGSCWGCSRPWCARSPTLGRRSGQFSCPSRVVANKINIACYPVKQFYVQL